MGPWGPGREGPVGPGGGWRGWHPGPHGWRRGDYFAGWRAPGYRIPDWHAYPGLYAPPPGYYWTRYDNQYLLTEIATGLIAGIVGGVVGSVIAPSPAAPGVPPPPGIPPQPGFPY
ncbi:hypothetical protein AA0498_2593 [Acidomonas methanolica]|nr:hypothetical protein AA0498_2593 [Acidomonas methanolica]